MKQKSQVRSEVHWYAVHFHFATKVNLTKKIYCIILNIYQAKMWKGQFCNNNEHWYAVHFHFATIKVNLTKNLLQYPKSSQNVKGAIL